MRWRDRACSRLGSRRGGSVVLGGMKVPPGRGLFVCAEATAAGRLAATTGRLTAAAVETRKALRLTLEFAIAFYLVGGETTGTAAESAVCHLPCQLRGVLHSPAVLPIEPFRGTPEEIERQWYERVYRGRGDSMLQLTWRAVLMGSALGGVLSLTNLYIGLKAGWGFGVAITACILSYAIWTSLHRVGLVSAPMTILENNCMQSTPSSAGYSTGGTLISAFAAYMMINDRTLSLPTMLAWVFFLSVLGVTMAIPMKRQMINVEQLRFPSGIAAAETLRALHSTGETGMRSARALGWAALIAFVGKFWAEGLVVVSAKLSPFMIGTWVQAFNQRGFGPAWTGRTVMLSWEPMFIAAGAITGLHVSASMLLGSVTAWMIFTPLLQHAGVIEGSGYASIVQWTLRGGVACMVTSSLLSFGLQWRTALRAFADLRAMFGRPDAHDPIPAIQTPASRF